MTSEALELTPEQADIIEQGWDVHVHVAPSLFPRWGDGWKLARACKQAGMSGVVLKAHHGTTVESAACIQARTEDFAVHGGVVLNYFVGGFNVFAVEAALALGARLIWMPTIHAAFHGHACGALGGFSFQNTSGVRRPEQGLTATDEDGALRQPVRDILAAMDGSPAALATGHCAYAEIVALQRAIRKDARRVRLLINHAFFSAPALTPEQIEELSGPEVWFETVSLSVHPQFGKRDIRKVAQAIEATSQARWVLASDAGQRNNAPPPLALSRYALELARNGLSRERVRAMLTRQPSELLGS